MNVDIFFNRNTQANLFTCFIFTFGGFFFNITCDFVERKFLFLYVLIEVESFFFFRKKSYLSSVPQHFLSLGVFFFLHLLLVLIISIYFCSFLTSKGERYDINRLKLPYQTVRITCGQLCWLYSLAVIVSILNSSQHLKIAQFQVLLLVFKGKLRSEWRGTVLVTSDVLHWMNLHFLIIQLCDITVHL